MLLMTQLRRRHGCVCVRVPLTSMASPSRSRSTWAHISFSFTEDCGGRRRVSTAPGGAGGRGGEGGAARALNDFGQGADLGQDPVGAVQVPAEAESLRGESTVRARRGPAAPPAPPPAPPAIPRPTMAPPGPGAAADPARTTRNRSRAGGAAAAPPVPAFPRRGPAPGWWWVPSRGSARGRGP